AADEAARIDLQHGPLDHRRLREHERDGLALVERALLVVRQLAKGRAGPVEELFPARSTAPPLEPLRVDAVLLIVVKRVLDRVLVEPRTRLLYRVAIPDPVDRHAHRRCPLRGVPW